MKCEQCGRKHNRKRFCSNKCKDRYHNLHNPRGIYAHLADMPEDMMRSRNEIEWEDPGWDGHKDSF